MPSRAAVLAIIAAAAVTLAAGGGCVRTPEPGTWTEYFTVLASGKKIGHAVETRVVAGGKVTTTVRMEMTITRMGTSITVRQGETSTETTKGKPLAFKATMEMGNMMAQTTEGSVGDDGKVTLITTTGQREQQQTFPWPEGAVMSEGMRLLAMRKGLAEGTTYQVKMFVAAMRGAVDQQVRIGPKRKVDLLGRVLELTEVVTTSSALGGQMTTRTYVDKDFKALKSATSLLGMNMEVISCTKAVALSKNDLVDFLSKVLLTSPQPLEDVASIKSVTYHLVPTSDARQALDFVKDNNQTVVKGSGGTMIVTVRPTAAAEGVRIPYAGKDKIALDALKPTTHVQSDDKKVIALARKAVGNASSASQAIRRIEAFVNKYVSKKSLSVGYASAAEVAVSKTGDCSEHAVLAAAMCRAVGIPSEVVAGIVYVPALGQEKHVFGPHAWVRAYVGGKWIGLDPTTGRFDAGHVAVVAGNGNPEGFFKAINTLGYFKIAKIEIAR